MIRLESQHELAFPPEAVWPILSKTDWLNRSLGLPAVNYDIKPGEEGGSVITARARILGREMRWRELPFEWTEPEFYRVHRIFHTGPFKEVWMGVNLNRTPTGTQVVAFSEMIPRNAVGKWMARRLLGPKAERDMRKAMAHLETFLRGRTKTALPRLPVQPVNEGAFQAGLKKLRGAGQPDDLVRRLESLLRETPDVELSHIRPFAVARSWETDPWRTLELFLHATRCGLLDLSWEVLCPDCRSTRQAPANSLVQLQRTSHCEVCQIKFDAEFDKSVELKFAVNPGIRPQDRQTFCLAGPGGRPHVVSQLWLEPREERFWNVPPITRTSDLRSRQVKDSRSLKAADAPGSGERMVISCEAEGFLVAREPDEKRNGQARVVNPNSFPVLLRFEQSQWHEDILTAARVTNWQGFRDLFSNEVISPTEQITVGSQVILFTDLRGSTALYHELGDAPAYSIVRNHFTVLLEAVSAHHGTVVKTIGDAVMAVFSRVDEALDAVKEMHQKLATANPGLASQLVLKSSLHVGPCLAVNANDKLDFFGTTVNLAARMVDCCLGGDLSVSEELYQRPETATFLKRLPAPAQLSEVALRGFDTPHRVWRIGMT